jgi:hypothetical protein
MWVKVLEEKEMERIIGDLKYTSNQDIDYSEVEEITGYLDCRGADTKASFPKLTTVGGYIDCWGADTKVSFPKLKNKYAGSAKAMLRINTAFKRKNFLFYDGILSKVIDTKVLKGGVKVYRLVVVGKTNISYCIESDGVYSHGETIKDARDSLLYKVGERDKSVYEGWILDTKITKRQAIESYRVITGACEYGVRCFVEGQGKLKSKYTVREVIELTKGQYGNAEYFTFFSNKR